MTDPIQLTATRTDDGRTLLAVPEVGLFTAAKRRGELLAPGESAGFLIQLGVGRRLLVPAGVTGRIAGDRPERVHEPVDHGTVLYELDPLSEADAAVEAEATAAAAGGLVFASPHAGRFWHRPSPDEPAFCAAGDLVEPGTAVGLVEIMKTFTQVAYGTEGQAAGLPSRGRVVAVLVEDGGEVEEGQALLRVEPA